MNRTTRVILLEFNELTPTLLTKFIQEGALPNFERFRSESRTFLTEAAEHPPALEPWIQWVTVHTGLNYPEHRLFRLNEGHKLSAPRIWDVLSEAGLSSWICGSMNVNYQQTFKGCLVPDPWCTELSPTPAELQQYFRFIQRSVLEYSNDRASLSIGDYIEFGSFLLMHGLSRHSIAAVVKQLISERSAHSQWKRAAILDRLQFDVFRWYLTAIQPHFSTFFLNSTAHFQHSYWRHMEPDVFAVKPSMEDQREYGPAILFGYQQMDQLLGRFMRLAGADTTLVLCTAISQQPCLKYESQGGAYFHRPRDFSAVARFAGITPAYKTSPVMTHQLHLDFADHRAASDAETRLHALRLGDVPVLQVERTGSRIFTGCQIYRQVSLDARIQLELDDRSIPFHDLFYQMDVMKSGMHHRDGVLWIRTPERRHTSLTQRIPLATVAPTIIKMFGIPRPGYMVTDAFSLQGRTAG